MEYTVKLTEAENLALSYVAVDQDEWIQNAVHNRCRVAIDEIVAITVEKCLETGIQLPGTKDDIVKLSFDMGWVKTVQQRNDEPIQNLASE